MPEIVAKNFREAGNLVMKAVDVKNKKFLLDTWNDLVDATPVLTGKARFSWKISSHKPKTADDVKRVYQTNFYARPTQPDLSGYKPVTTWFITNTARYIGKLNSGYSAKAPSGFIDIAVQKNVVKSNG